MSGGKRTKYKSIKRRYRTRKRLRGGGMEKVKTILYDDKLPYFQRILGCIEQVNTTHFIITHDNDILIQFDIDAINRLVNVMTTNNIDAVKLHNITGNPEIHIKDALYISPIKDDEMYRYSVNPRLWNKVSALKLFSSFPQKDYRSSEGANVQEFSKKQKVYTLCESPVIMAYHAQAKCYVAMHITLGGAIAQYDKMQDRNPDPIIISEYNKIKNKYFKNTKRSFHV